ncbi:hypothetical protein EDB85DRAFT_1904542 [Lactarius pseudohatsudake]|nr:hypothetical protein EDB85DRAFT_1904542 [Lactarius pseudohatsudake]
MCALVPKAHERSSPHCNSAMAVGVGRPKVGNRIDQIGRKKEKTDFGKARGGNTSTPTEATRRHAKVAREGCHGERMRKDRKRLEGLKIEDTRKEGWVMNAPTEETRWPRSPVKGVIRRGPFGLAQDMGCGRGGSNPRLGRGKAPLWCRQQPKVKKKESRRHVVVITLPLWLSCVMVGLAHRVELMLQRDLPAVMALWGFEVGLALMAM